MAKSKRKVTDKIIIYDPDGSVKEQIYGLLKRDWEDVPHNKKTVGGYLKFLINREHRGIK